MIEQLRALFPGPKQAAPASEASESDDDFLDWMQDAASQETDAPPDGMALFMPQFGLPAQPLPAAMAGAALVGMADRKQPEAPETVTADVDLLAALPLPASGSQSDAAIQLVPVRVAVSDAPLLRHPAPNLPQQADMQGAGPPAAPPDPPQIIIPDQKLNVAPALLDSTVPVTLPNQPLAESMLKPIAMPPGPLADPNRSQSRVQQQVPVVETTQLDAPPRLTGLEPVVLPLSRSDRAVTPIAPEMAAQIVVTEFAPMPPQTPSAPRRDHGVKDTAPRAANDFEIAPAAPDSKPALAHFTQTPAAIEQPDTPRPELQPADFPSAPAQLRTADQPRQPQVAPANLTGQLLQHAATAIERQVDVLLSPEELGRVKFQIRHHGEQVSILLTAERFDTMEMLKRHGEELMREFRQAGFAGASLDFGRWGQQPQSQQQAPASFAMAEDFTLSAPPQRPLSPAPQASDASGLNIRL